MVVSIAFLRENAVERFKKSIFGEKIQKDKAGFQLGTF
jgi:hypothetical protein